MILLSLGKKSWRGLEEIVINESASSALLDGFCMIDNNAVKGLTCLII
jgi:hypothetical protein